MYDGWFLKEAVRVWLGLVATWGGVLCASASGVFPNWSLTDEDVNVCFLVSLMLGVIIPLLGVCRMLRQCLSGQSSVPGPVIKPTACRVSATRVAHLRRMGFVKMIGFGVLLWLAVCAFVSMFWMP
jgi:hypothetical protein